MLFTAQLMHSSPYSWLLNKDRDINRENFLWYCRLGHSSFSYLERLLPKLLSNISISSLRFEQCICVKNHRVPLKSALVKVLFLFSCVFTNVWVISLSFIDDCTRVSWVFDEI